MGLARLFGLCAALLFASSIVNASTINVGPSNYQDYGPSGSHSGGGVRSTFGQTVRLPPTVSGPTRMLPVSRNAVIPYGSIANGLKNFTRVTPGSLAASAAVTGLFLAMDWAFDVGEDAWGTYGDAILDEDQNFGLWTNQQNPSQGAWPTAEIGCTAVITAASPTFTFDSFQITGNGQQANCYANIGVPQPAHIGNLTRVAECPSPSVFNTELGGCVIDGEFIVLNDSHFAELEARLPSLPATTIAEAARDTQRMIGNPLPGYHDQAMTGPSSVSGPGTTSTSTDPVTGDTIVTTTNTTTNISYGDTTITTTNTTTSTTYQNGQETSTTVTTETPGELPVSSGGGAAGDWPKFCDWATVVCDWFNWTQEEPPPEQDLPIPIDEDFYQEKQISFGSKACPPDYEIQLPFLNTSVAVPFQPLCDFAGIIYYMVMAASYIIAAYISVGVARNA